MELERKSGILMHVTSLPSPCGIGDLGDGAYRFADFLHEAGQGLWQVLPLNPTGVEFGNSPYSSSSAFALNPLLISPQALVCKDLLKSDDLEDRPVFDHGRVDYETVKVWKQNLLARAFENFLSKGTGFEAYDRFCDAHGYWLDDHALFTAISDHVGSRAWQSWPRHLRDREERAREKSGQRFSTAVKREKFFQYLCFEQWQSLKAYCGERGIIMIGDIPLYVSHESADVWAHPVLFKLGENQKPASVSGVPPDFFSASGQLWNNPLFDWDRLKESGYSWWIERIGHNLRLFDCIRIDHFRGLAAYWEVPAGSQTAATGRWRPGPGGSFLEQVSRQFPAQPFIAEDLGVITEDVVALRERFELPGMRVFQFGFGRDASVYHRPHTYETRCVAYTGTHDNDTLIGWLYDGSASGAGMRKKRRRVRRYTGCWFGDRSRLQWAVIRALFRSEAEWVVVPMQDVIGIGTVGRMNTPGTTRGNWEWRILPEELRAETAEKLRALSRWCRRI